MVALILKVAWIKADDKGILAMHDRVLTNNARLSVMHSDLHTWTLHIRDVRRSDRGNYMCQINTDPMRSQVISICQITFNSSVSSSRMKICQTYRPTS